MTLQTQSLNKRSLFVCVASTELTDQEKKRISHPIVAGVILFSRNFENSEQLTNLTQQIRLANDNDLLIIVDNEGGRVQRFKKDGFTHLPSMLTLTDFIEENDLKEQEVLSDIGYLMATEVIKHGIDISLAPVLDINNGSDVIGDRAFSNSAFLAGKYASSFVLGMQEAGMASVGKHFPGHGSTKEDSHFHTPVDTRTLSELMDRDLIPFNHLTKGNLLKGIMPAHIQFTNICDQPVGYSKKWINSILKQQMNFVGAVFSDDLAMVGASQTKGDDGKNQLLSYKERALKATLAGCDFLLICNQPEMVDELLDSLESENLQDSKRQRQLIQQLKAKKIDVNRSKISLAKQRVTQIRESNTVIVD